MPRAERVTISGDDVLSSMAALSDPTRMRLLRLLEREELGVAELCDVMQLPQSTVSRHLKTLDTARDGGWLVARREGTARLYRLLLDELEPGKRDLWRLAREQTESWATAKQDELRLEQVLSARKGTGQFFEGVAEQWEQIRRTQYGEAFDLAAAYALLPAETVVADLGCGTGQSVEQLAPLVAQVHGVDASGPMLKAARSRLSRFDNVKLHRGQLDALPIDEGSCDLAQCVLALSYVEDPSAVVREMRRILRPGGRAVIVDLLAHDRDDFRRQMGQRHQGFSPGEARAVLKEAGFASVRMVPLPPDKTASGPALFVASGQ